MAKEVSHDDKVDFLRKNWERLSTEEKEMLVEIGIYEDDNE